VATVAAIMDALAEQLSDELCGTANPQAIPNLQVDGRMIPNPTPPAIDIYPADPFQVPQGFNSPNPTIYLTVRARVTTADSEGGQDLLLAMMDPDSSESVAQAILSSRTLGSTIGRLSVMDGPSAFGVFQDTGGDGNLLGCTWTVQVHR
jgi:hypothetical protein